MKFSLVFGTFMSRVILSVFYFTLLLPYGVAVRLFSDPLHMKTMPEKTGWNPYPEIKETLDVWNDQY